MSNASPEKTVGSSLPVTAIVAALAGLGLVLIGFIAYLSLSGNRAEQRIVIATGPEAGSYHALGVELGHLLEEEGIVDSARILATEGSASNMELIENGQAHFAFTQSDTPAAGDARLVAALYEEYLHVLVRSELASEIRTVFDLRSRRVSLGGTGSGTRQLAERVLEHFRVEVEEDLALSPEAAAAALADGSVDAAFIATAIPSATVERLSLMDAVRFLSLGDAQEVGNEADGLALVFPSLHATTIPHSTYGPLPERPVLTVGVTAQLIASCDVGEPLARQVTSSLFEHRSRLAGPDPKLAAAARIRERYRPMASTIPYHPGAVSFYVRQQPPFVVEYAETMSLALTVLVGVYSGYIALREWARRRRKNRIDAYYVEANRHFVDVRTAELDSLVLRRDALVELRHRAFSDLVNERLDASESFTILQDQIDSELRTIEALIATKLS